MVPYAYSWTTEARPGSFSVFRLNCVEESCRFPSPAGARNRVPFTGYSGASERRLRRA
jgi:hypothetical protein